MKFSPNETNIDDVYKIWYSALYAENNFPISIAEAEIPIP